MNEIKLHVDDKNLETILTILDSLKSGLLSKIEINGKQKSKRAARYQPKTNTVIREEESGANDTSGKYINKAAFKQRLKKR